MKNTRKTDEVSDFINEIDHPLKKGVEMLREIILGADKGITEHIKWNAPSFCFKNDDRITMGSSHILNKDNVIMLVFHRGAGKKDSKAFKFEDESGLLEWKAPDRAVVRFASIEDIEIKKAALKKLAKKWMLETS